ncbi:universal stress protein [Streptomyces sp. LP05-1]|uniref:Universal stress protein n=1 Tax=Streptomyces pyxinae TaxID=2970734 RepID=A0ABT2CC32_9ACTN|nr:universal stress protein [Streptomyces sp. LP05-1]MCS0634968.1 universal stress protein [Streptomyces sp. LP05-1]
METRGITVGVDGSPESLRAVDWAAAEAERRKVPLRALHAWLWQPLDVAPVVVEETRERVSAAILRQVETRLAARRPQVSLRTEAVAEPPVPALLKAAQESGLLVLGSRGHGAVLGFLLGSYGLQVIASATCPVVAVREAGPDRGEAATGEVVVGQQAGDADDADNEVLAFAFGYAALHGARVRAVRAWNLPVPDAFRPAAMERAVEAAALEPMERARLAAAVAPWRERYPGVPVVEHVELGNAGQVLLSAAAGARLLVVGRRARPYALGARIGSTAYAALHHAGCPVAVVPHD